MRFLRRLLLALLILVFIAAIVAWTLPADFVYRQFANRLGPVTLDGVSGTVWGGHADSVAVFGQPIGLMEWTTSATTLLGGDVVAVVHVAGPQVTGDGTVARRRNGDVHFSNVTLQLPAQTAQAVIGIPTLQLGGQVDIKIDRARLNGIWFDDVQGQAHWRNAGVTGSAQAEFGEIESQFASEPDTSITGTVHDKGGPLIVDGTFHATVGFYEARARLAARDGNPQVTEALQYVGQAQTDGSTLLLIRGPMFKLF